MKIFKKAVKFLLVFMMMFSMIFSNSILYVNARDNSVIQDNGRIGIFKAFFNKN